MGVSNHQPHHCLLNRLFRRRSKKTSKLRVTGLCVGNSPQTGEFPAQMASDAENVSICDVIMRRRHTAAGVQRVVNLTGAENGIFRYRYVNTMIADDLAPCVARSSATIVLTLQDERVLIFHEVKFPPSTPSKCGKRIILELRIYFYISKQ